MLASSVRNASSAFASASKNAAWRSGTVIFLVSVISSFSSQTTGRMYRLVAGRFLHFEPALAGPRRPDEVHDLRVADLRADELRERAGERGAAVDAVAGLTLDDTFGLVQRLVVLQRGHGRLDEGVRQRLLDQIRGRRILVARISHRYECLHLRH